MDKHGKADKIIQKRFRLKRSSAWPKAKKKFLTKHSFCSACGTKKNLNVHHIYPFHYVVLCGRPDLEIDPRNFITLCDQPKKEHHILLGHLDDFNSFNPEARRFAVKYKNQTSIQIRRNPNYSRAKKARNIPIHPMKVLTAVEKKARAAFKRILDKKFRVNHQLMVVAMAARHS